MQKIVLITGGSRGLGCNAALKLAARGLDVIVTYHSNKAQAESLMTEIEALGRRTVALQLDVVTAAALQRLLSR